MRYFGTIIRWNKERGFGAIREDSSGKEYFAPLASFEEQTPLPEEGRRVSFEVALGRKGREEAENVRYPSDAELAANDFFGQEKKEIPPAAKKSAAAAIAAAVLCVGVYFAKDYMPDIKLREKHVEEVTAEQVAKEIMAEREQWKRAVSNAGEPETIAASEPADGSAACTGISCPQQPNDIGAAEENSGKNTKSKPGLWDKIVNWFSDGTDKKNT